ncbi:NUDIX hydrolase [Salipaludibacillus sp. LMS25]|uniref:NUDIX hydrolase n=1 Tax=Salipaludibacillus sp. LMS25 TaxID=2924031 RepID=UPI0020CFEA5F|nr:NUDIX hydrolase [Salipaludibacillus sp. LMS25]UTR13723.1 NUDIX hydrolase [Salipaludibacillus sp. LMS25]
MDYVKALRQQVGNRPLILTGAAVIIMNERDEMLLQHRIDGGWGLPGGLMELGETMEQTARREVAEETGLQLGKLTLLNVFSGPEFYYKLENGDEFYAVSVIFVTNTFSGEVVMDETESRDLQFFSLAHLPKDVTPEYQRYIDYFLKHRQDVDL